MKLIYMLTYDEKRDEKVTLTPPHYTLLLLIS